MVPPSGVEVEASKVTVSFTSGLSGEYMNEACGGPITVIVCEVLSVFCSVSVTFKMTM